MQSLTFILQIIFSDFINDDSPVMSSGQHKTFFLETSLSPYHQNDDDKLEELIYLSVGTRL